MRPALKLFSASASSCGALGDGPGEAETAQAQGRALATGTGRSRSTWLILLRARLHPRGQETVGPSSLFLDLSDWDVKAFWLLADPGSEGPARLGWVLVPICSHYFLCSERTFLFFKILCI